MSEIVNVKTPATDASLAEIRALAIDNFAEYQRSFIGKKGYSDAALAYSARRANEYARQLRGEDSK